MQNERFRLVLHWGEKVSLALILGLILTVGLNAQTRLAPRNDPDAAAKSGQAEIIINTSNSDRDIAVWLNGAITAHVPPKSNEKIIVNNGLNIIEVADTLLNRGQWRTGTKKQITLNSNSNRMTIGMTLRYGAIVDLSVINTTALGGGSTAPPSATSTETRSAPPVRPATPPPVALESDSIENAVYRAAWVIIENLPANSIVAVLSISSNDPDLAEFIIEEIVYLIVDTKKFKVVDRKSLDAVRSEAHFQYSGDVDDVSAVSIGKLLGASIVITGSVSGSGATRRLRAKALNVQTAEIVTMASERF